MAFRFERGPADVATRARRGTLVTAHGRVETPAFMPVGTRASVTGLTPEDVRGAGAQMILGNTYHLMLRPGPETFDRVGGIHRFMGWDGPVLTDSGGFQIFSLAEDRTISEEGARFRSYIDQRVHLLSPERSIAVQTAIGADVMMALDVCIPSTADPAAVRMAMERTHRWALRSLAARGAGNGQALFAIVQGGLSLELRAESAAFLTQHPFDGFAIGGVAVGDTRAERAEVVAATASRLPEDRPRYLMGVGTPPDLLEAIAQGIDMFDCILPTTLAWQGTAFTSSGRVRLTRGDHARSDLPLDGACPCPTCRRHPRAYLHHLFKCGEPLGPRLVSVHNLTHYLGLMQAAREAIAAGRYAAFAAATLEAIDRHEHDSSRRSPGRRPPSHRLAPAAQATRAPASASTATEVSSETHELVLTRLGAPAIRDRIAGEVMHPVIGPAVECERLYVGQSRLRERLAEPGGPLVLFDVGLGAAGNAFAAWRAAHAVAQGDRRLEIVSFERALGALALALSPEAAGPLGIAPAEVASGRELLATGRAESIRCVWRLVLGDLLETLPSVPAQAEVVFWDPFSPQADPQPWTRNAFELLIRRCTERAVVYTYSTATATRAALLLAGFFVGTGDPSGPKEETTAAACDLRDVARPLDRRWLARLERSSAAFPPDAPVDALERIRQHPQFR
jgi:queuine tRNA-ribosyltransferase